MFKACLFDLDGVIVDTAKYHFLAWKRLSEELGINFTIEDNERLKGVSRMRSLDIILEIGGLNLSDTEKNELASKKNNWYVDYLVDMKKSEILPGVLSLINELKSNQIKIALGSASKNSAFILKQLEISDYFDAIVDGNSVSKAKPDPEVFLNGASLLNTKPNECIVFEDAIAGIEAAKNANMLAIGIGSKDTLHMADHVVGDLLELDYTFLKNLFLAKKATSSRLCETKLEL